MSDVAFFTVIQIAEKLQLSTSVIYDLLRSGKLKHFCPGNGRGCKRISQEQLNEYLATTEKGGQPKPIPVKVQPRPYKAKHL